MSRLLCKCKDSLSFSSSVYFSSSSSSSLSLFLRRPLILLICLLCRCESCHGCRVCASLDDLWPLFVDRSPSQGQVYWSADSNLSCIGRRDIEPELWDWSRNCCCVWPLVTPCDWRIRADRYLRHCVISQECVCSNAADPGAWEWPAAVLHFIWRFMLDNIQGWVSKLIWPLTPTLFFH